MDFTAIVLKLIEVAPRFIPNPKPPKIDYGPLYEALPKVIKVEYPEPSWERERVEEIEESTGVPARITKVTSLPKVKDVSTGCISCSRSHLSTVSGALGESLRFARDEGIKSPEVQRRLMLAEDEVSIMERIDLAADALAKSPPEEKQLAEEYLPRIRKLRQNLGQITSLEKLEEVAAEASILSQEFRLRHLQLRGVDLNPVMTLAKDVQEGRLSMEEAKAKLKEILPVEGE